MRRSSVFAMLFLIAALVFGTTAAYAVPVDIELLLLNDVSGSIDASEYNLMVQGYAAAFQDAAVQAQIANNPNGIAVAMGMWSGGGEQSLVVNWTKITNAAEANAFAASLLGVARPFAGATAPQSVLNWAVNGGGIINSNGFEGTKRVIDVAGDGDRNDGLGGTLGRDAALAAGVTTINGLVVGGDPAVSAYYNSNVLGGTAPQLWEVASFADFERAMITKIFVETGGTVPEPGFVIPLALGLLGLAWQRRRQILKRS